MKLLAGLLALGGLLSAHHGNVAYDTSKAVVIKGGTVTKFVWANPHCFIMFDAKDDKGNLAHWAGEAGSPSAIAPLGWSSGSLQPGDTSTGRSRPRSSPTRRRSTRPSSMSRLRVPGMSPSATPTTGLKPTTAA
jgi:hypothetical protein